MNGKMLAVAATAALVLNAFADVTLVRDGAPAAKIVVGEKPTRAAQFAAYELQHVVELITGAKLEIVAGDAARGRAAVRGNIYVGCAGGVTGTTGSGGFANAKDFVREEYLVAMRGGNIVLAGNDAPDYGKVDYKNEKTFPGLRYTYRSTEYAVYDFLERECGVRFYGFGDDGTAFVPRKTLVVAPFADRKRAPKMDAFRDIYWAEKPVRFMGQTQRDTDILAHRWRMNVMFGETSHSVMGIFARYWKEPAVAGLKKLFIEHRPDYFAKGYEGKNAPNCLREYVFPGDADLPPSLCTSSEGPVEYFADEAVRLRAGEDVPFTYAKNPIMEGQPFYYPVQEDDSTAWCKCEKCLGNPKMKDYLFRHFDWVSRIGRKAAAKDPLVNVSTLAYEDTLPWPKGIDLAPNMSVEMCLGVQSWFSPNVYRYQHGAYKDWVDNEGKRRMLTLWTYQLCPWHEVFYIHHYGQFFPVVYPRHMGRFYKEFVTDGIRGAFLDSQPLQHLLELYVAMRLCDDATLDPDQIIDEHYRLYYGAAADAMKRFADELESYSYDIANYSPRVKAMAPTASFIYRLHEEQDNWYLGSTNAVKRFSALMDAAKAAAKTPLEKRRVAQYAKWIWDDVPAGRKAFEERQRRRSIPTPWIVAENKGDWGGDVAKVPFAPQSTSVPFVTLDNEPADTDARFAMAADKTYVYLRYTEKGGGAKEHIKEDIWGNGIEIHLYGAKKSDFLQVAVAPSGEVKANVTVVEAGVRRWAEIKDPPKARSVATDAGWTAEIAIPYSLLPGGLPAPHYDRTPANVFRTRFWPGAKCLAWSPIFANAYLGNEDRNGELVFCALPKGVKPGAGERK